MWAKKSLWYERIIPLGMWRILAFNDSNMMIEFNKLLRCSRKWTDFEIHRKYVVKSVENCGMLPFSD